MLFSFELCRQLGIKVVLYRQNLSAAEGQSEQSVMLNINPVLRETEQWLVTSLYFNTWDKCSLFGVYHRFGSGTKRGAAVWGSGSVKSCAS